MKIQKKNIKALLEAVKSLKITDDNLRYDMIDSMIALQEAHEEWQHELKVLGDLEKEQIGLTDEMMRLSENIDINHAGENKPLSQEEKEAAIAVRLYRSVYEKDATKKSEELVEVDAKLITLEDFKKLTKDGSLSLEDNALIKRYFVEKQDKKAA